MYEETSLCHWLCYLDRTWLLSAVQVPSWKNSLHLSTQFSFFVISHTSCDYVNDLLIVSSTRKRNEFKLALKSWVSSLYLSAREPICTVVCCLIVTGETAAEDTDAEGPTHHWRRLAIHATHDSQPHQEHHQVQVSLSQVIMYCSNHIVSYHMSCLCINVILLPRDAVQGRPISSCGICLSVCVCVCVCLSVCVSYHVRELCENE